MEAAALAYQGNRTDAQKTARSLQREAHELGVGSLEAMTTYILAESLVDPQAAAACYQKALVLASRSGADFVTGLAETSLAALELRTDQHQRARRRLRTVIDHWERGGIWNQQWLAIRLLIETLERDQEDESAATLLGAYAASAHAGPAYGDDRTRLAGVIERCHERLGSDHYDDAHRHGETLTDAEAATYARSLTR